MNFYNQTLDFLQDKNEVIIWMWAWRNSLVPQIFISTSESKLYLLTLRVQENGDAEISYS